MALYIPRVIGTAMKRIVFGAIVVVIAIVVLVAGIVAATAKDSAYAHQSMYDTDMHAGTNSNATKDVAGHASETDAGSIIAGGCLVMILIAIVAIAMYKTREEPK